MVEGSSPRPSRLITLSLEQLTSEFAWEQLVGGAAQISGVSSSSRTVRPGDVFVALSGGLTHGAHFVAEAVDAGATAVVTDASGWAILEGKASVPVLLSTDPRADLGLLAARLYGTSEVTQRRFGVTGTNGKTTVVYMVDALLRLLGRTTGVSSTAERLVAGRPLDSSLTTPEADEVHSLLGVMIDADVTDVVIEVSAHGLTRHRLGGIFFDVVCFTNFSQDHLDDYRDMEEYFLAKRQLFVPEVARLAVVCVDDAGGRRMAAESSIPAITVASADAGDAITADWTVEVTEELRDRTAFRLGGPNGEKLESAVTMVGAFQATNAALAIVMAVSGGVPFSDIERALAAAGGLTVDPPGRLERLSGESGPLAYVDYGHTPVAFAKSLDALRRVTTGRLIMVFGADGDRDQTKRGDMGRVAAEGADVVIITDYNPRSEDPAVIRSALMAGAVKAGSPAELREVPDQRAAVRLAISLAQPGDCVLYAGPGHETHQEVAGQLVPYDARDDVKQALRDAGWVPQGDSE